MSYARILVHYPYVVLFAVFVVVATCLVVSSTMGNTPNFSDPTAGFEPRGTEISKRIVSYENLVKNADNIPSLQPDHTGYKTSLINPAGRGGKYKSSSGSQLAQNGSGKEGGDTAENRERRNARNPFFCGNEGPDSNYIRIAFQSRRHESLFSMDSIKLMCQFEEEELRSHPQFQESCVRWNLDDVTCCRSWSLGNYIALLTNKTHCYDIDSDDVAYVLDLLTFCAKFYHNLLLNANCNDSNKRNCRQVPTKCIHHGAVYQLLHYITDIGFLPPEKESSQPEPFLKYAMLFLPMAASDNALEFYSQVESPMTQWNALEVAGVDFGIKYTMFLQYMLSDLVWLSGAGCVIFLAMLLYTASLFITVMTFLAMFWSLEMAYFLYTFVFEIKFFPFMNMVAAVFIVGIGCDDAFIFCKLWSIAKSERNNGTLEKIVLDTLKHSALSMFVTSFTTAAAFYATCLSSIISVKSFGIYAGTTVLCNFVLMVTWLPASVVVYEKWCNCCVCYNPEFYSSNENWCYYLSKVPYKIYNMISEWSRIFFEKLLPCLVIKLRFLWLFLLGGLGVCGIVAVFYYPKMKLPTSKEFHLFSADHLFERYDIEIKPQFAFEHPNNVMPITVVWGIHHRDNGDTLNPDDKGTLTFDSDFDITLPESQEWLLDFCRKLRKADFYLNSPGFQITNCFLENFRVFMSRPCVDEKTNCCNETFPFSKVVMIQCLAIYIPSLQSTPFFNYNKFSPGPRFSNGKIGALIVEFMSNEKYSLSYEKMKAFYNKINRWVNSQMIEAPAPMRNGWFVSHLQFFDLQNSLVMETPLALCVSLIVTGFIAFFTTLNILVSLYAVLCISCIVFVTVGALVCLGWELNIFESIVIVLAVGMSIDYTLHYGVAYRLSPGLDQEMRVSCSIGRVGSVIFMAALTTFLVGVFILPSAILAYQKFGIFLLVVISVSWFYSTFFFQSLLVTIGPRGGFGQFHWPSMDCCAPSHKHVDRTVYALSESTMSSSSTVINPSHPPCSSTTTTEIHELEPLTERLDSHTHHHHHHHHHYHLKSKGQYARARCHSSSPERSPASGPVMSQSGTESPSLDPGNMSTALSQNRSSMIRLSCSEDTTEPEQGSHLKETNIWVKQTDIY